MFAKLQTRLFVLSLSMVLGVMVAGAAVAFFSFIRWVNDFWEVPLTLDLDWTQWHYSPYVGFSLLVAALIAGQLLRWIDNGRPHGPADLILAAQSDRDPDLRNGFKSTLLALVNASGGASVGIFGPLVHLGGCVSHYLKRKSTALPGDLIMGSGAGAAIAAVFAVPIGGAIFAHEAVIRRFSNFGPSVVLVSSLSAYLAAKVLMGQDHQLFSDIDFVEPAFDWVTVLMAVGVGVASGLASIAYIYGVTDLGRLTGAQRIPLTLRPLVPAAVLFALSPLLPHLLGVGVTSIDLALAGQMALLLLVALAVLKILMSSLCLSFGFFGGVFGPALFIGVMVGSIFDVLLMGHQEGHTLYAAIGGASVIASVIGAPIASIVIMFEMTDSYAWSVLSMVSVVVSGQISRAVVGRSLFDRQLMLRGFHLGDDKVQQQPKVD